MSNFLPEPHSPTDLQLDLVCNEHLMNETHGLRLPSVLQQIGEIVFPVAKFLLTLTATIVWGPLLLSFLYVWQGNYLAPFVANTIFTMWLLSILLMAVKSLGGLSNPKRGFPTNVLLAPEGLRIAWRAKKEAKSPCIPWPLVRRVTATKKWNGAGTLIQMYVRLSDLSLPEHRDIRRWFRSLRSDEEYTGWQSHNVQGITIQFPLEVLTLEADRFKFITSIKEHVPPEAVTDAFNELFAEDKIATTYTQLWLDDMTSFRRARNEELESGTLLHDGRFEVKQKIASGGQATIYSAMDSTSGQLVALKELVLPVHGGPAVRQRAFAHVQNEAALLAAMDHPGIVKIRDHFNEDHRAYLVLEHVQGKTLRKLVEDAGPLPEVKAIELGIAMAGILNHLHTLAPPIVHRDFTPDNVMVSDDGRVRLLDFNVAQQMESNATKTVVGKHNYMAPEQFKGKPCTQSDLYSFGCTLYYVLTGTDPVPLSASRPSALVHVRSNLDDIVVKLTCPALAGRYDSAGSVMLDLSDCTAAPATEQATVSS